jgi:hypothetical protein
LRYTGCQCTATSCNGCGIRGGRSSDGASHNTPTNKQDGQSQLSSVQHSHTATQSNNNNNKKKINKKKGQGISFVSFLIKTNKCSGTNVFVMFSQF